MSIENTGPIYFQNATGWTYLGVDNSARGLQPGGPESPNFAFTYWRYQGDLTPYINMYGLAAGDISGATGQVVGLVLTIRKNEGYGYGIDNGINITKANGVTPTSLSLTGDSGGTWPVDWKTENYGGPTVVPAEGILVSELGQLGVRIKARNLYDSPTVSPARIDGVTITVYYDTEGGPANHVTQISLEIMKQDSSLPPIPTGSNRALWTPNPYGNLVRTNPIGDV